MKFQNIIQTLIYLQVYNYNDKQMQIHIILIK